MMDATIERRITIDAPIEVVWRTITERDQIRRWFSDEVELKAKPGAVGTLTFRAEDAHPHVVEITVVEVEAPHVFSFRWVGPQGVPATPENSMLVTFRLTADSPARTTLHVSESGLEDLPWPEGEKLIYIKDHRNGWTTQGDRLLALFTTRGPSASP
jgi:uncharacterized protein YndB with AHSA1/START domain